MLAARAVQAAQILDQARVQRRPIKALPEECTPADLAEGYAIQRELIRLRGGQISGWKVGCISAQSQARARTNEPFSGPVFEDDIYRSKCVIPKDSCFIRALQVEFAFRLNRDLVPRDAPFTEESIRGAIGSVTGALEIADTRFDDWTVVGAANLIADAGKAGLLVIGDQAIAYADTDLIGHQVSLYVGGEKVASGSGRDVMGDPVKSLLWLANSMAEREESLWIGQLVSTGTCTGSYPAEPGDEVVAEFGTLGRIEVRFQ